MISIKEASIKWNISERRISALCMQGRIAGAVKNGRDWEIPKDAVKPVDKRMKTDITVVHNEEIKLPLPVGISDYRLASTEYYYVDKTMMIKDFIDEKPAVSLFTRPRRFGKTLNMDMIRTFFEKADEDTSIYFKDKKIWQCGEKYLEFQGKYPVIFLSFKDIKYNTWEETYQGIYNIILMEYVRHSEIEEVLSDTDKEYYNRIIDGEASQNEIEVSLLMLSKMLHEYYKEAAVIIIDEYDTPIQQGHLKDYYDKIILFMRNLFSGGLKDNKHLAYGFMTGILRVAKESIFSGLNNLTINSILDCKYSEYFGFTKEEVREMAAYYGAENRFDEICEWYDGYRFDDVEIFNPWSVINYFRNNFRSGAYWQSTGSNDIIGEILDEADEEIYERLRALVQGKSFLTYIDTGVIYPQIKNNPSTIYSFLLMAGYLKYTKCDIGFYGDFMCEVALPNREIMSVYNKEILQKSDKYITQATAVSIQEALYCGDTDKLQKQIKKLLLHSASYYDTVGENFYHGLMLGLCAVFDNRFEVTSNREAGEGRYDIQLMPKSKGLPGFIIELKHKAKCNKIQLDELAKQAIEQININNYNVIMKEREIKTIYKYGMAFSGKDASIVIE